MNINFTAANCNTNYSHKNNKQKNLSFGMRIDEAAGIIPLAVEIAENSIRERLFNHARNILEGHAAKDAEALARNVLTHRDDSIRGLQRGNCLGMPAELPPNHPVNILFDQVKTGLRTLWDKNVPSQKLEDALDIDTRMKIGPAVAEYISGERDPQMLGRHFIGLVESQPSLEEATRIKTEALRTKTVRKS